MASWRNIGIFVGGVYALSILGGVIVTLGYEIGGLVFIISPILMAVMLRMFAGEGWSTAGLRLNLRGHGFDYALALLVWPVLVMISLVGGTVTGALELPDDIIARWWPAFLVILPLTMIYALFEEFGWRGYLEPQIEALGVPDLTRHLLVGGIWTLWHIPYLMTFGVMGTLPLWVFAPIYLIETLAMAVWYGVVRKRTDSVWPAVIAHGLGNAIMWPLIIGELVVIQQELVFAPRPDSLLMGGLLVVIAALVWRRRL